MSTGQQRLEVYLGKVISHEEFNGKIIDYLLQNYKNSLINIYQD